MDNNQNNQFNSGFNNDSQNPFVNNNQNDNQSDREYQRKMDDQTRGNTILMTVIGVATLLVALVGATFAYFSATVSNASNQSVSITTATPAALEYKQTKALTLTNAKPGDKVTDGSFTVTNPAGNAVTYTYDLNVMVDDNTFSAATSANQLLLSYTVASSGANVPTLANFGTATDVTDGTTTFKVGTSTPLVSDQKIAPGETHTFTGTLEFVNLNVSQNENQGKSFVAHIDADDVKSVNS